MVHSDGSCFCFGQQYISLVCNGLVKDDDDELMLNVLTDVMRHIRDKL